MQTRLASFLSFSWRSFRLATWLGWQIESNWADPFLFTIYSLIKPLSSAAILVIMYSIITKANFDSPIFPYIYLGNAFYMYVGHVMTGISWAVIDDREHYKTMKYIYTAPVHFPSYLLGRGVARFIIASISVVVTIVFGMLFLNISIDLTQVNWVFFCINSPYWGRDASAHGLDSGRNHVVAGSSHVRGRRGGSRRSLSIQWGHFSIRGIASLSTSDRLLNAHYVLARASTSPFGWHGCLQLSHLTKFFQCPTFSHLNHPDPFLCYIIRHRVSRLRKPSKRTGTN